MSLPGEPMLPPREIFASYRKKEPPPPPPPESDQASESGLSEPGLQELETSEEQLPQNIGIHQFELQHRPKVRLAFLQPDQQEPRIVIPDGGEEWDELACNEYGLPVAATFLGAKQKPTQLSCNCEYKDLKITISFIPYGDDALLDNRTGDTLHVESVPNQLSIFEVDSKCSAHIYPGCWRVSSGATSIEFRLRPRSYRIVLQQEMMKRTAGQICPPSSKRVKGLIAGGPSREPRPIATGSSETVIKTVSRPIGSTGLGVSKDLRRNETLHLVDEATGDVEYSVKYVDRMAISSHGHVFKGILSETRSSGPRAEVVAVKIRKLNEHEGSSNTAFHMRHWQHEVDTHRGLRHPSIAGLIAFDARLLTMVVEYKQAPCLADPFWRFREGVQKDRFKGYCKDACVVMADMASALAYLAEKGIVHNDVAPRNILYTRDTARQTKARTVLIDFGESRAIHEKGDICGGRPWYVAPEWIRGKRELPADVWSLGVVMLYLLRRLRLPELNEPEWQIADIPTAQRDSPPLILKLGWLEKVEKLRDGLKVCLLPDQADSKGEKVRRLVQQMLDTVVEQRIDGHDLAKETQEWASFD